MKNRKAGVAALLALIIASPWAAFAALYDRGHGLIYDSVLNITWLQDAQYAQTSFNWAGAEAWAHQLDYLGITGWRLPTLTPVAGGTSFNTNQYSTDGSTDYAYNISSPAGASAGFTGNELAYMYFVNLHDLAQVKPDGTAQSGAGLLNVSFVDATTGKLDSFKNVARTEGYWTGVQGAGIYAFLFLMATHPGFNDVANNSELEGAWAVHNGDVAALLPPPSLLNAADAALGQLYGSSASVVTAFAALAGPVSDPPASEPPMRLLSVITLLGLLWIALSRKPKSSAPFRRS